MRYVQALTAGGQGRLVGHPSIDVGIHYLAAAAQDIVLLARNRHDLHVEVSCADTLDVVPSRMVFVIAALCRCYPGGRGVKLMPCVSNCTAR